MISILSDNSFSTSFLILLNMNGFRIKCKRVKCSETRIKITRSVHFKKKKFQWTISLVYVLSSILVLFSAWLSISLENHSLNSLCESNIEGIIKCNKAHNSAILFWIGVPLNSNRFRQLNPSSIFHLTLKSYFSIIIHRLTPIERWNALETYLLVLLIAWASSNIKYCHLIRLKYLMSVITNW